MIKNKTKQRQTKTAPTIKKTTTKHNKAKNTINKKTRLTKTLNSLRNQSLLEKICDKYLNLSKINKLNFIKT